MNAYELNTVELTPRVMRALDNENDKGRHIAATVIARRALVAEQGGVRPRYKQPKLIRAATIIAGLALTLSLAGCLYPLDIGTPIVTLQCRTPDGYPFTYTGPADTAPYQYCGNDTITVAT